MGLLGALTGQDTARAIGQGNAMQQEASLRSGELASKMYEQGRQDLTPWTQAGQRSLGEQEALMGLNGDTAGAMRSLQASPGYQFRLQQGIANLNAGLAARGGMGSGKAMAAGQNYAQGFASNEYGNRLSQLAGLSGQGQASAAGQANQGNAYAGNMSNLWTGAANASAASGMAGAQANQSGLMGLAGLGIAGYKAYKTP